MTGPAFIKLSFQNVTFKPSFKFVFIQNRKCEFKRDFKVGKFKCKFFQSTMFHQSQFRR